VLTLLPILMFACLAVLMFTSLPVAFILGGLAVVFAMIGWSIDAFQIVEFYNLVTRIWSPAENLALIAIPCFIFMGLMLDRSEIARDLLHALQTILRRVPGGLAMSITVMSTIMAAITGIIGASVVMMTVVALPTMLRVGYHPSLATGTIAASSCLGILIPPSILLVFLTDMLQVSEGVLFAAALFPGLVLSGLYIAYIGAVSTLVPGMAPPRPPDPEPLSARELAGLLIKGAVPPVLLIAAVLGSIFAGIATISESAAVGVAGVTLLAWVRGRLDFAGFNDCLQRATLMMGMIFMLFGAALSFSYVFRVLGGEEVILSLIETGSLGDWQILIVLMAVTFLMGFFFDILEILLIAVPVFAPIVGELDFGDHLPPEDVVYWFAILIAVNLQTSFLTPPMGLALFYMKSAAPEGVTMRHIYVGIVPFVILQLICVGLVMAFPTIAMWLPHALFDY
jgi:tripartite ATP-independent transporter DctM subunit